jgi:hypothetical protein
MPYSAVRVFANHILDYYSTPCDASLRFRNVGAEGG